MGEKCKFSGLSLFFSNNSDNNNEYLFHEYRYLNLGISEAEERIYNLIASERHNLDLVNFRPAELYEALLSSREKKNLGQAYTPDYIIHKMLYQLFEIKKIDRNTKILDPSCGGGYFLIEFFKKIKD